MAIVGLLVDDQADEGDDDAGQDESGEAVDDLAHRMELVLGDVLRGQAIDLVTDLLGSLVESDQEIPIRQHRGSWRGRTGLDLVTHQGISFSLGLSALMVWSERSI